MPNDVQQQNPDPQVPVIDDPRPPAVRAAAAKADQMQRDLIAGKLDLSPQPTHPSPPASMPVAQPFPQPTQPAQPQVVAQPTQPAAQPTPAPHPTEATDAEIDAFLAMPAQPGTDLARYQHMLRSERGRRQAQERLLAQLGDNEPPPLPSMPTFHVPEVPDEPIMSDEDREAFGPELSGFIEQTATRIANRAAAAHVKQVVEPLNQHQQQAARLRTIHMQNFLDKQLAVHGFTFEDVNTDPGFNQWLALTDGLSGATRKALLLDAWNSQDGSRVLKIVGAYLDTILPPPNNPPPAIPTMPVMVAPQPAAPQPPARQPQRTLLELAAPGRAPNAQPVTPQQLQPQAPAQQTYTRAEIRSFYAQKLKGMVLDPQGQPYTPQQIAWIENDIAIAGPQGRIIG